MKQIVIRTLWLGCVVWLVPFVVAIGFYTPEGGLRTDIFVFKSVMIVVSSWVGLGLMAFHLGRVTGNFTRIGLLSALAWLAINWGLDVLILLPLSKQSPGDYFTQIGLGYLSMVAGGLFMGRALDQQKKS